MKELVEVIAKSLVDYPDQVVVTETENEKAIVLELRVAQSDMGKVIGKQGRIAKAIRSVVKAAASKEEKKVIVEICSNRSEELSRQIMGWQFLCSYCGYCGYQRQKRRTCMEDLLQVGVITTTHGVRGEVKVFPTTDDPARFKKLKNVILDTGKEKLEL